MSSQQWVEVDVEEVIRETENAFLFLIDGDEVWIPKSQLRDPDDYEVGYFDLVVVMSAWIKAEKELE